MNLITTTNINSNNIKFSPFTFVYDKNDKLLCCINQPVYGMRENRKSLLEFQRLNSEFIFCHPIYTIVERILMENKGGITFLQDLKYTDLSIVDKYKTINLPLFFKNIENINDPFIKLIVMFEEKPDGPLKRFIKKSHKYFIPRIYKLYKNKRYGTTYFNDYKFKIFYYEINESVLGYLKFLNKKYIDRIAEEIKPYFVNLSCSKEDYDTRMDKKIKELCSLDLSYLTKYPIKVERGKSK